MPFVAPTFAQTAPGMNDYGTMGDPSVNTPGGTSSAVTDGGDDTVLKSINRPDWVVVSKSPPGTDGSSMWIIAGPNGQSDHMIVGGDGRISVEPTKTPEKPTAADTPPSPPDKWVPIVGPDGTPIAMQDPAHPTSRVDIPKPPAARTDTPAETQNAATSAANSAETARHNQVDEAAASRLAQRQADTQDAANKLAQSKLDFDKTDAQAKNDLESQKIDLATYQAKVQEAHDNRMSAQAEFDGATNRLKAEQDAQFQQGQLANASAQNTETARSHQATEAQAASDAQEKSSVDAATLLQRQQQNDQAAADAAATRGESLLKDRATLATGVNNAIFNAASTAKNIGLGTHADISGLPQASQDWATSMMGGQSLFDQAVKQVHEANPSLSGTPQGAAYASLMEQILGKKAQLAAGGLTTPSASTPDTSTPANSDTSGTQTTAALAPAGQAGTVSPSDPRYLGAVIGHATSTALGNMQLTPDAQFTAPGAPTG